MDGEVVFEKRYPKAVNDTLMAAAEAMVEDLTGGPERREARLSRALAGRVLVPLPQRRKSAAAFIQTAPRYPSCMSWTSRWSNTSTASQ